MFWVRNKENSFTIHTLVQRPDSSHSQVSDPGPTGPLVKERVYKKKVISSLLSSLG